MGEGLSQHHPSELKATRLEDAGISDWLRGEGGRWEQHFEIPPPLKREL